MITNPNIALIYFSRTAKAEATLKSWDNITNKNQRFALSKFLRKRSLKVARKSNFDLFEINEESQKGRQFGEKINNAFRDVFNLGYDAVICIGNDCINIDKVNWKKIAEHLSEGKCVIGPDFRDGAYLIALTKTAYNPEDFQDLSWQSSNLKSELIEYCEEIILLETLHDINSFNDITELLNQNSFKAKIIRILRQIIINVPCFKNIHVRHLSSQYFYRENSLRAPPVGI